MPTFHLFSKETKSDDAPGDSGGHCPAPAPGSHPLTRAFAETIYHKGYSEGAAHTHQSTPTTPPPFDRLAVFASDHPLLTATMVLSVAGLGLAAKPAAFRRGHLSTKPQTPGLARLFSGPHGAPSLPAAARFRDLHIREAPLAAPSVLKVLENAQHDLGETQAKNRKETRQAEEAREARIAEVEGRLEREGALEGAKTRGVADLSPDKSLHEAAEGYLIKTTGGILKNMDKMVSADEFVFPIERNTSTSINIHRGDSGILYANKSFTIISPHHHDITDISTKARRNGQTHVGVYGLVRVYTPIPEQDISLQTRNGTTFKAHLLYFTSAEQTLVRISLDGYCLATDSAHHGNYSKLGHVIGRLPDVSRECLKVQPGEQDGINAAYERHFDQLQERLVSSAKLRFEKKEKKRKESGEEVELFKFPDVSTQPHPNYIARGDSGILYDKSRAIEIIQPDDDDKFFDRSTDGPIFVPTLAKVYKRVPDERPSTKKFRSGKTFKVRIRYEDVHQMNGPIYIAIDGHVLALMEDNGHFVVERCSGFLTDREKNILEIKAGEVEELEAACKNYLDENAWFFEDWEGEVYDDIRAERVSEILAKETKAAPSFFTTQVQGYVFPSFAPSTTPVPAIPKGTSGIRYDSNKAFEIIHRYNPDSLCTHDFGLGPSFEDGIVVVYNKWNSEDAIERLEQGVMLKARLRYDHDSLDSPSYIAVDGFVFSTRRDASSNDLAIERCEEVIPEETRLALNPNAKERVAMSEIRENIIQERKTQIESGTAKEEREFKAREAKMLSNLKFPTTPLMPASHITKSPAGIRYTKNTAAIIISPTWDLLPCHQKGYVTDTEYVVPALVVATVQPPAIIHVDFIDQLEKGVLVKAVVQYKNDVPVRIAMDGCFFSLRFAGGDDVLHQFLGGLGSDVAELLEVQEWERPQIDKSIKEYYERLNEVDDPILLASNGPLPSPTFSTSSTNTSLTIPPPLGNVSCLKEWDFTSSTLVNGRPAWVAKAYEERPEVFVGSAPSISEDELMDVIFDRNGRGLEFFIERSVEEGGWTLDTPPFGLKDAANERMEERGIGVGLKGWERYHRWIVRVRGAATAAHGPAFNGETRSFTCAVTNNFIQAKALYLPGGGDIGLKLGKSGEYTIHQDPQARF
ncbi:hypothetical protein, variant [Cryptococcus amylolentus CBS 6039]|uniref:Uncharacterized protein n=1 Tax=Cryptococcus amylolentus CBS 6039 TaxID=1295533 RepID=A0A1E3HNW4_9TREE|nr:hypothetical protein, variant [Cryptococcus amylolentus CBS 6039]ODN78049.1 hypothetical protein, variant [Cryptococcus amylolentus CBS 6039]